MCKKIGKHPLKGKQIITRVISTPILEECPFIVKQTRMFVADVKYLRPKHVQKEMTKKLKLYRKRGKQI